jgi:hypothetical protein
MQTMGQMHQFLNSYGYLYENNKVKKPHSYNGTKVPHSNNGTKMYQFLNVYSYL